MNIISTQRKSLWPPTDMKTDKTRPIAIYMGYRSDTNLCIAHSWIPPHTYTHCARYSLPLLMTHNIYPPASIPPCTLLPVQCVVQTPTDSTHHLMDFLRRIHAHEHTHTHSWSQFGVLSELSLSESNYLSLSLSLASHGLPPTEGEGQAESVPMH